MSKSELVIRPGNLKGWLNCPPSKSHTLRALLVAALAEGTSHIKSPLQSEDTEVMVAALRQFGIAIEGGLQLSVQGVAGKPKRPTSPVQVGKSGVALRFCSALAALCDEKVHIHGDPSLCNQRPVQPLIDGLVGLRVRAESLQRPGRAPLAITGPMQPGWTKFSGEDSQPVSALLLTTPFLAGNSYLSVVNAGELPWIEMTFQWLRRMGAFVTHKAYAEYTILGNLRYPGFNYTVPGDWSSAAFPLAAALLTGSQITMNNVDLNDVQGDKRLVKLLRKMGGDIRSAGTSQLVIDGSQPLIGRSINVNFMIDALPILAVIGCCAEGETCLYNGRIARFKESDRIAAMTQELRKMGGNIREVDDGLQIKHSTLVGTRVDAHGDHRVAMALAVAAMVAKGSTTLTGAECIKKSYPSFVRHMLSLGADMKLVGGHALLNELVFL